MMSASNQVVTTRHNPLLSEASIRTELDPAVRWPEQLGHNPLLSEASIRTSKRKTKMFCGCNVTTLF